LNNGTAARWIAGLGRAQSIRNKYQSAKDDGSREGDPPENGRDVEATAQVNRLKRLGE
jgi:hypothetical protein